MNLTPKEQKVLSFIKSYSEKHGYAPTYAEIQEKFHYSAVGSVQQFIKQLVAKGHLRVPLGDSKKRAIEVVEVGDSSDLMAIPLEGQVAAGRLTEAVRQSEALEVPRSFLKTGHEYFALRVKGDSMIEDCILDGDLVVIRRQPTASNGQTVVALVDDEATIKRYYKRRDHIELHPANPQFDVIQVKSNKEFKILGVLASVIRKLE